MHDALQTDFIEIDGRKKFLGIVESDLDAGAIGPASCRGGIAAAVPDHVFAPFAAQRLYGLLAQNETEGFCAVRFSGTVRADDAGDSACESQIGFLGE